MDDLSNLKVPDDKQLVIGEVFGGAGLDYFEILCKANQNNIWIHTQPRFIQKKYRSIYHW